MILFIHETKIKIIPYFRTNEFHLARIMTLPDVIITNYELRITNYKLRLSYRLISSRPKWIVCISFFTATIKGCLIWLI
jgi:hypothetical protein